MQAFSQGARSRVRSRVSWDDALARTACASIEACCALMQLLQSVRRSPIVEALYALCSFLMASSRSARVMWLLMWTLWSSECWIAAPPLPVKVGAARAHGRRQRRATSMFDDDAFVMSAPFLGLGRHLRRAWGRA